MQLLKKDPIPALPSQYQVRVEIHMPEKQQSIEMQLFYDYNQRKAAVEVKGDNKFDKLIYNYETNEIFVLQCKHIKTFLLFL
jgi:hypothetical protein